MVTTQLAQWAQQRGYPVIREDSQQDMVARNIEGYTFGFASEEDGSKSSTAWVLGGLVGALIASGISKSYVVKVAVDGQGWSKQFLKDLNGQLKGLATAVYNNGVLTLSMKRSSHHPETYDLMDQAAAITAGALAGAGIPSAGNCPICQREGCEDVMIVQKPIVHLHPAHGDCIRQRSQETLTQLEAKQRKGNIGTGLVAAILGGVLGAALAALVTFACLASDGGYDTMLNSIMHLFVPMLAFFFYRRAGGPVKWWALLLVTIIPTVLVTGVVLAMDYFYFLSDFIPFSFYPEYLLYDEDAFVEVFVEIVFAYLFGFIGLIVAWIQSFRYQKKQATKIQAMRERAGGPAFAPPMAPAVAPAMESTYNGPDIQ